MEWKPIEYFNLGPGVKHLRGIWVYSSCAGKPLHFEFELVAGFIDEDDGEFYDTSGEHTGWNADQYEYFCELPPVPEPMESVIGNDL